MRYVKLRVWLIFAVVVIGVIVVLNYSTGGPGIYKSTNPITDSLLTATYPDLYNAITERDAQKIRPFLSHEHPDVREQAWRALANTSVDSVASLIALAEEQNTEPAWFAISMHELSSDQLQSLQQSWIDNPEYRSGIAQVLGRQGNEESLNFLINQFQDHGFAYEYPLALAVGRLVGQSQVDTDRQIDIIQQAFDADSLKSTRAYLYGWYRSDQAQLSSRAQDTLYSRWQVQGVGVSHDLDQFVNRLIPERTTYEMTVYYNGEQLLDHEAQLSYELATSIDDIPVDPENTLAAKILLTNTNPHVQVRTLQSLSGKIESGDDLQNYITEEMIPDSTLSHKVWLQAVETALLESPDLITEKYRQRLRTIPGENLYLWPQVLGIYADIESMQAYLDRIDSIVSTGEPRPVMYALQSLNQYWDELSGGNASEKTIERIRSIVFDALELHDRGVSYTAASILSDETLFSSSDFEQINQSLSEFSLPADVEVYQAFGALYQDRFADQAKPIINEWATQSYAPLNRSLADAGWQVEVPDNSTPNFRLPDWNRLWNLGRHPVLTLRTEKGFIEMKLNTLSAPATVAMVDSMHRAGHYVNVPFHRVVPNFVIQGGDIERKDGFGGPDFVIPTEASEEEFERGAVGIASAGTDTEGSQYFIMHQWKPHLNGHYTRFGSVQNGMDVVDEIVEGDSVLSTTWY